MASLNTVTGERKERIVRNQPLFGDGEAGTKKPIDERIAVPLTPCQTADDFLVQSPINLPNIRDILAPFGL